MMHPGTSASSDDNPIGGLLHAVPCGLLLLRDGLDCLGHFLLPWLTAAALQQGHSVVVVAAAYSPSKHRSALRKIGAAGVGGSIGISGSSGGSGSTERIAFVTPQPAAAAAAAAGGGTAAAEGGCLVQQLYQQVAAAASQLLSQHSQPQRPSDQPGLTIVLDSLACLSCLAAQPETSSSSSGQLGALLHYLAALGERLQARCRLVLLASRDAAAADAALLAAAAAQARLVADVAPLEGRTAALDGSLTVNVRQAAALPAGQLQLQQHVLAAAPSWCTPGAQAVWFFRAGDTAVRWLRSVGGNELMA